MSGKLQRLEEAEQKFLLEMKLQAASKSASLLASSAVPLPVLEEFAESPPVKKAKKKKKKEKEEEMVEATEDISCSEEGHRKKKKRKSSSEETEATEESTIMAQAATEICDSEGCEIKKKSKKRKNRDISEGERSGFRGLFLDEPNTDFRGLTGLYILKQKSLRDFPQIKSKQNN